MAPVRPNRNLPVPLQSKTRPRPLTDTVRNATSLPKTSLDLNETPHASHAASFVKTKNGREWMPN